MKNSFFAGLLSLTLMISCQPGKQQLTNYVNPFLGTATLWETKDLGYERHLKTRTWGAEVFPGSSVPNAMVQLSPVTQFRSGAGYQYEDTVIYGFSHTNKGHWNLLHLPILPVTGNVSSDDYASKYSHTNESAHPGYYQVFLERYGVNAELTSTLRCAYHKYTFRPDDDKKVLVDITRTNNGVRDWSIQKVDDHTFSGNQDAEGNIRFYAVSNYKIQDIKQVKDGEHEVSVVSFADSKGSEPLELKIGFSFVSIDNAKMNLEQEMKEKSFAQVRKEADKTWENLLSKIEVTGGTEREKGIFYSCLYRSFLWPVLRSDVNGEYTDAKGNVVNNGFRYYTDPSFWDDYRNKLILLGMISPDVATDVIKSITDRGKIGGFMPTFFHGDHASTFVTGSYLRGIRDFDVQAAYELLLNNAFVEGSGKGPMGGRRFIKEYMEQGWISEDDITNPKLETVAKAAVTKTQEYAYDDYATALLAKELGDSENYEKLMKRTDSYKHLFDPSTQFMRGRLKDGTWITPFDPKRPFYEYMYREANGWQSTFFAPHDSEGFIALYPSKKAFENKLDSLFMIPWDGYEAHNLTTFIGQYCHGNQPGHSSIYMYYFVDKQEKAQKLLNRVLNGYYRMGPKKLAYSGMDDAGEMSSWYVLNAIGLYTYSPADPEYIVTVPLFEKVIFNLDGTDFIITRKGAGEKINEIRYGEKILDSYFISHSQLKEGKELIIVTN